ncbi:hypothetical protein [Flavobacterium sp. LAR06]|uniref:hypothetical protein n=1 Tax=Flavobacterium sp. LAR06 TaxID=3064897 RepID=UPI0035C17274
MTIPKALYNNNKFEKFMESIIILYLADDEFKVICDDYCITKMISEQYKKKKEEDTRCQAEYESVSAELEDEILRFIKNLNAEDDF